MLPDFHLIYQSPNGECTVLLLGWAGELGYLPELRFMDLLHTFCSPATLNLLTSDQEKNANPSIHLWHSK